jgi:hypothetical protein
MDTIKSDWRCVGVDYTQHWNMTASDKALIERIISVYIYDANECTHLCELTPSHFLIGLHHSVHFTPEATEEDCERIYGFVDDSPCEDIYLHCSAVEKFTYTDSYGPVDPDDTDPMETVREYYQGNWPF